ncbi:MAG: hypothetical protein WC704_03695 [Sphingomonas sp.]
MQSCGAFPSAGRTPRETARELRDRAPVSRIHIRHIVKDLARLGIEGGLLIQSLIAHEQQPP